MVKLCTTSFTKFIALFLVCGYFFSTAEAAPIANNASYITHVGTPVSGTFPFSENGAQGTVTILVTPIPTANGHITIIGNDFVFSPNLAANPNTDDGTVYHIEYKVMVGTQLSNLAYITVTQQRYKCLRDCPLASRWATHYYFPRIWGPEMTETDVTVEWENSALVFRAFGTVGDRGQRVAGFHEMKYHPIDHPTLAASSGFSPLMYTFNTNCLTNVQWPNQFNGPSATICQDGLLNDATLCNTAPMFALSNFWQLEYGTDQPCKYTFLSRFPFSRIITGNNNPNTARAPNGDPLFSIENFPDNTGIIVRTSFYSSEMQPNHPDDVSRGWEDRNTRFDITLTLQTEIDVEVSEDIISCDPHCERLQDGSLFCQDLCRRRTTDCAPTGQPGPSVSPQPQITTSVFSTTFPSGTVTVTSSHVVDESFILETTLLPGAANAANTYDGTVVIQVCLCTHCVTYTRRVIDLLTSVSLSGGFVGTVRVCRANPLVPNPLTTAADICEEVDAKTFGPPDRATLFFDIKDVEPEYVEPLSVSAKFTAWGVDKSPVFRNDGYGDGSDPQHGLTGVESYFGYHEPSAAVRTSAVSRIGPNDFACTLLPGVVNDNFKMTFFATLKIHSSFHGNEPNNKPVPTNPFVPNSKRFRALEDAPTLEQKLAFKATMSVDAKFSSTDMQESRVRLDMNGGAKIVSSNGDAVPASGANSEDSSSSSSSSSVVIAVVVGIACVLGLVIGAVVMIRRAQAKNAATAAAVARHTGSAQDLKTGNNVSASA